MKRFMFVFVIALLVSLLAACGGENLPGSGGAAARVNGKEIPMALLQEQMDLVKRSLQEQGADLNSPDAKAMLAQASADILDQLIAQELINQAAAQQNLTVSQSEIAGRVEDIAIQVGGKDKLDELLKKNSLTMAYLERQVRDQLVAEKLFAKITENVAGTAEQVHASHILVATEKEALDILAQIKTGGDFAALAKQYSQDPGSRDQGGDLGFFPRGAMVPEFENVAFSLAVGQVSNPVQTAFGFHLIKVLEKDANHPLDPQYLEGLKGEAIDKWITEQRNTAQIEKLVK